MPFPDDVDPIQALLDIGGRRRRVEPGQGLYALALLTRRWDEFSHAVVSSYSFRSAAFLTNPITELGGVNPSPPSLVYPVGCGPKMHAAAYVSTTS